MISEEEYLAIARKHYQSINALNDGKLSFYDYEQKFAGIMDKMSREVLEKTISTVPVDRRKKKLSPDLGL